MFNFNKFNRRSTVRSGIDTRAMTFKPLKDFVGHEVPCDGFFFTDGKYGKQTVVVGCGYLINMPGWATPQFEAIAEDRDALDAVMHGELALVDIHEITTKNGSTTTYSLGNIMPHEPVTAVHEAADLPY